MNFQMVKDVAKEKQDKNQRWGGKRRQKELVPDHADSVDGDVNLHCHDLTVRQLEFSMVTWFLSNSHSSTIPL